MLYLVYCDLIYILACFRWGMIEQIELIPAPHERLADKYVDHLSTLKYST